MKEWLCSEPHLLLFAEVWDDIRQLLKHRQKFKLLTDKSSFSAKMLLERSNLQITVGEEALSIHYDSLQALWQQNRAYGFSMQHIAPGLSQEMNYLIPILAELPYVSPVQVAENYKSFRRSGIVGIQLLPLLRREAVAVADAQLSLF